MPRRHDPLGGHRTRSVVLIVASDAHRGHHCLELSRRGIVESTEGPERADIIARALRAALAVRDLLLSEVLETEVDYPVSGVV